MVQFLIHLRQKENPHVIEKGRVFGVRIFHEFDSDFAEDTQSDEVFSALPYGDNSGICSFTIRLNRMNLSNPNISDSDLYGLEKRIAFRSYEIFRQNCSITKVRVRILDDDVCMELYNSFASYQRPDEDKSVTIFERT